MTKRLLTANSIAHLLVDGVCASVVASTSTADLMTVFILYNTLAFSSQCVLGLLTDRFGHCSILTTVACIWVALCGFLPLPPAAGAILIGLGNSLFHIAAGSTVLEHSEGKAAPLGLFVAPGALGVFAGKAFPQLRGALCVVLTFCAAWLLFENHSDRMELVSVSKGEKNPPREYLTTALFLLFAVMTRAIGGAVSGGSLGLAPCQSLLLVFCVFAGKSLGGVISDRIGIRKMTMLSVPLAAILILLTERSFAAGAAGQFLLNLSMPITLLLVYRCLPKAPGFSFGLAASVLWPGTLIGKYISVSGEVKSVLLLLCFGVSLFSILYTDRKIYHEKSN